MSVQTQGDSLRRCASRDAAVLDGQEPPSVLLVAASLALDGGGTAVVARLFLEALAARGDAPERHLQVVHLGGPVAAPLRAPLTHCCGSRLRLVVETLRTARRHRPTAVIYDHLGPAGMHAYIRPCLPRHFAVYLHGIEAWGPRSRKRLWPLRHARVLMANSEYTARRVRYATGITRDIAVVQPALEPRLPVGPCDEAVVASAGQGYLLMIGRMVAAERYKGHDEVLEALATWRPLRPRPALVVVGSGDDAPRLRTKARALGLGEAVQFTGFVSEATREALLARASALVMPSREEGFGLVFLEAMRAARPSVALAESAAAELIVHGETGILVPPGDGAALAGALRTLLDRPDLARQLGIAARQRWLARHQFSSFRVRLGQALAPLFS